MKTFALQLVGVAAFCSCILLCCAIWGGDIDMRHIIDVVTP